MKKTLNIELNVRRMTAKSIIVTSTLGFSEDVIEEEYESRAAERDPIYYSTQKTLNYRR